MTRTVQAQPERLTIAARARRASWHVWGPALGAAVMMLLGILLRAPTAWYTGAPRQSDFNSYIFRFIGAYSDISSLYFRDRLWLHPLPYFEYAVEYPVLMAWLIWLIGFVNDGVMPYFLATAAVMLLSGLLIVWLGSRFEGANMWLLALSPALPLYVVLNWDMFSILLTVAALLFFRRDRDGWGAAALTAAVWTKFFPIVLVPLVVLDRLLKRRWRDAFLVGGIFALGSIVVNAPVAFVVQPGGIEFRPNWLLFFRFNRQRPRELNLWNLFDSLQLTVAEINRYSALLLILGIVALMALMSYSHLRGARPRQDLLVQAALAAIGWFFFVNKVYSPQYSLWLAVLLALLAAPPALVVAFGAIDIGYFATSFIGLYLSSTQNPAASWFYQQVMLPSAVIREVVILGIVGFALWRIAWLAPPGPRGERDAVPQAERGAPWKTSA